MRDVSFIKLYLKTSPEQLEWRDMSLDGSLEIISVGLKEQGIVLDWKINDGVWISDAGTSALAPLTVNHGKDLAETMYLRIPVEKLLPPGMISKSGVADLSEIRMDFRLQSYTDYTSQASSSEVDQMISEYSNIRWIGGGDAVPGGVGWDHYSNASNWAKPTLDTAWKMGLIPGSISPDMRKLITRKEFCDLIVTLAEKASGKEIEPAMPGVFSDTDALSVRKAYASGLVNGMGDGMFAPRANITREQIAAMMGRLYENYIELSTATTDMSPKISDKSLISDWARLYVFKFIENGVITGFPDGGFHPLEFTTREQAVVIACRLSDILLR